LSLHLTQIAWLALEGSSRKVESIFSVQLPTPFHHHYFRRENRAPLRLRETWPRLNSCTRSMQLKGTPTGAYLAHPSIKAEAKAGKQLHDSFSKLVTLTYLLILSSLSSALPRPPILLVSSSGGSGNEAPNGKATGGCPCLSPRSCDATMGRGGLLGGTTTREHVLASGYLL
jgi:hypothetical protein